MKLGLEADGFALHRAVLSGAEVDALLATLPSSSRGLLDCEAVVALVGRVRAVAGDGFFAVRGMLFDKTSEANWALGWHQDLTVAVRERKDTRGFGPWTVKAGVPHAGAPVELLERMVNLRVHLDDCGADAGPLRVKPGSHLHGRLDDAAAARFEREHVCVAARGDVLAFKPLLLHASASSSVPHRRVLQLELSPDPLPGGLEWHWRV